MTGRTSGEKTVFGEDCDGIDDEDDDCGMRAGRSAISFGSFSLVFFFSRLGRGIEMAGS